MTSLKINFKYLASLIVIVVFASSLQSAGESNVNSDSWMGDINSIIGNRMLHEIAFAGSHDAGMNVNDIHDCSLANLCNTATQNGNILYQLQQGSRYFDIRPLTIEPTVFGGTVWSTGHTSVELGHQLGCEGERLASLRDDLYKFFADSWHKKELVILKISHCGMEPGQSDKSCSTEEKKFIASGLDIDNRLIKCDKCDLKTMTLNQLLEKGNILLLTTGVSDSKRGFFSVGDDCSDDYLLYDEYSNNNNYQTMKTDQFNKLKMNSSHTKLCDSKEYPRNFLLSWTLTLSKEQIVVCEVLKNPKIINISGEATSQLEQSIENWVRSKDITKHNFINILYTDAVQGEAAKTAVYLNRAYDSLND